ncbi:MAG: hypothetical protein JRF64_10110 [Deltaproteobacteria bacterium]|nr:hypothetical protein [Deltaproteobacteria bacterium]
MLQKRLLNLREAPLKKNLISKVLALKTNLRLKSPQRWKKRLPQKRLPNLRGALLKKNLISKTLVLKTNLRLKGLRR